MRKIIMNYTSNKKPRRLVIDKDLPFREQILYPAMSLHAAKVISFNNVLSIKEEVQCA